MAAGLTLLPLRSITDSFLRASTLRSLRFSEGMMSLARMPGGTVQVGLMTTLSIIALNTGVSRNGWPTTARVRHTRLRSTR